MLGIIINPKSGKNIFRAQRVYLWRLLRSRHQPFTYRVTQYAGHAMELARELVEKGYDQILVLGGDGTLSEAVSGIMKANIPEEQRRKIQFGLMPRGTGNDWARFWGLDKRYKRSLDLFFNGKAQPIDVGCLTYWRNNIEHHHYFINSIGFGIDAVTCVEAAKIKYYIGSHHVNYLFGLLISVFSHKPMKVELKCDDQLVVNDLMFTMNIGNGPYSGGGMKQNPQADPRDGIFHSMFVEKPTFKQIIKTIPYLFNGKLDELPFIHTFSGSEVSINTKKHLVFEADGILGDIMGPCRVTCMHHALCMTVPAYTQEGKEIHDF